MVKEGTEFKVTEYRSFKPDSQQGLPHHSWMEKYSVDRDLV